MAEEAAKTAKPIFGSEITIDLYDDGSIGVRGFDKPLLARWAEDFGSELVIAVRTTAGKWTSPIGTSDITDEAVFVHDPRSRPNA